VDPTLLDFFFNKHHDTTTSTTTTHSPPYAPSSVAALPLRRSPKLLLFTALIPFMQLHTRRTGMKAREAILSSLSLRDSSLFDFIAHQTLFCRKLAEGLGAAYIALPSTLESRGKAQEKQSDAIQVSFYS
jgi:hypothetical protein